MREGHTDFSACCWKCTNTIVLAANKLVPSKVNLLALDILFVVYIPNPDKKFQTPRASQ
jgi:hypothetical protein